MAVPSPGLPAQLLDGILRTAPAAPLVTFYDDATDERTELSGTTLANWVAKTANLLQDEFDVGPGSRVAVALPVHWQTAAVLLGVWACGAAVVDTAPEDDPGLSHVDVVLAAQDRLPALADAVPPEAEGGPAVLGFSLHPLGLGMSGYAGPARDYAVEVRAAGDVFVPYRPGEPESPGLLVGSLELTLGGLTSTARELAGRLGLTGEDRLLADDGTAAEVGPVGWLLAPLAAGASLVLCRNLLVDRLPRRAATERVTATLGPTIDGVRELGRPG